MRCHTCFITASGTHGDLGDISIHATQPSDKTLLSSLSNNNLTAAHPFMAFQLSTGFKVGFSAGSGQRSISQLEAALGTARSKEEATYVPLCVCVCVRVGVPS